MANERDRYEPLKEVQSEGQQTSRDIVPDVAVSQIAVEHASRDPDFENGPTRPTEHYGRRGGWSDGGDLVSQEMAALARLRAIHEQRQTLQQDQELDVPAIPRSLEATPGSYAALKLEHAESIDQELDITRANDARSGDETIPPGPESNAEKDAKAVEHDLLDGAEMTDAQRARYERLTGGSRETGREVTERSNDGSRDGGGGRDRGE